MPSACASLPRSSSAFCSAATLAAASLLAAGLVSLCFIPPRIVPATAPAPAPLPAPPAMAPMAAPPAAPRAAPLTRPPLGVSAFSAAAFCSACFCSQSYRQRLELSDRCRIVAWQRHSNRIRPSIVDRHSVRFFQRQIRRCLWRGTTLGHQPGPARQEACWAELTEKQQKVTKQAERWNTSWRRLLRGGLPSSTKTNRTLPACTLLIVAVGCGPQPLPVGTRINMSG